MPNIKRGMMGAAGVSSENTFMWGVGTQYNNHTPIGDGTIISRSSPVLSISGLNWTAIGMNQSAVAGVENSILGALETRACWVMGQRVLQALRSPLLHKLDR